jgi:hypothetical protein
MSEGDDIRWVPLTLDFSPEDEAWMEARAKAAGQTLKCFCVHLIHEALLRNASDDQKNQWARQFPATLRRNGCENVPPP